MAKIVNIHAGQIRLDIHGDATVANLLEAVQKLHDKEAKYFSFTVFSEGSSGVDKTRSTLNLSFAADEEGILIPRFTVATGAD